MFEPEELMARIVDLEEQLKVSEMAPPAAEQLIACLEGEIAKRDEVIVGLTNSRDFWREKAIAADDELAVIKAQGVVMPERWNVPRQMWKDARQPYGNPLNHADIEAAEKFNLALDEVARLNAAPVQQVSVPDVLREAIKWADHLCFECGALVQTRAPSVHVYNKTFEAVQAAKAMLAAAPAAPAADALLVEALDYQVLFDAIAAATSVYANGAVNISVQAFRDALAAHRAKGVV